MKHREGVGSIYVYYTLYERRSSSIMSYKRRQILNFTGLLYILRSYSRSRNTSFTV